jgi:hypothetical protein
MQHRALSLALINLQNDEVKLFHYTTRRHLGERRFRPYSFLTSVLDGRQREATTADVLLFRRWHELAAKER